MTAAELDLDTEWDLVLPLVPFLDRAWLLPCHVTYLDLLQVFGVRFLFLQLKVRDDEFQIYKVIPLILQNHSVLMIWLTFFCDQKLR